VVSLGLLYLLILIIIILIFLASFVKFGNEGIEIPLSASSFESTWI
jgi:hypothetical protein